MKKKILVSIMAAFVITCSLTTPAFAATHQQYHFNLAATGQKFNLDTSSGNNKVNKGQPWTFKPLHLETGASPYGMLFVPYHRSSKTYCTSAQRWRKKGQYDLVYTSFGVGNTGGYYLAARTDDAAAGTYASDGWWNSDTVN